jgi:quercetin dioxygenase-like cupin family protein
MLIGVYIQWRNERYTGWQRWGYWHFWLSTINGRSMPVSEYGATLRLSEKKEE